MSSEKIARCPVRSFGIPAFDHASTRINVIKIYSTKSHSDAVNTNQNHIKNSGQQHYVFCLQGFMFWLSAQTELPLKSFFSFLDTLEWPQTAVLLSVEAVMEAKLQHVSERSCPGKTTDL